MHITGRVGWVIALVFGMSSVISASITVPFINNMLLGRTFDYSKSIVGNDIFTSTARSSATSISHQKSEIKYKVVKSSEDVRDVLDISGQLSLKVMGGLVDVEGKGSYLKSSVESGSAIEVMAKIHYRTVTKTLTDDTDPITNWHTKKLTGKHYIRSLTYGGYLIASFKFHAKDDSKKEEIKAAVEANVNTAKLDVNVKGQFEHIANSAKDLSTLTITYSSSVIADTVPVDFPSLKTVIENFTKDVKDINGGDGVPIEAEIRELVYLENKNALLFVKNSMIFQKMEIITTMFHDLKSTSDALENAIRDVEISVAQETKYGTFYAKICSISDEFYKAIQNIDLNEKSASSTQFKTALAAYKDGEPNFLPGKYMRKFQKLRNNDILGTKNLIDMGTKLRDSGVHLRSLERLYSGEEIAVKFPKRVTTDYMISRGSPGMNTIMICFAARSPIYHVSQTIISYSTASNAEEFRIGSKFAGILEVSRSRMALEIGEAVVADLKWHSWCIYWDKTGIVKVYKDGESVASKTGHAAGQPIKAGGTWVVGQQQTKVSGSIQYSVPFKGKITNVNIYRNLDATSHVDIAKANSKSRCRPKVYTNLAKSWNDFKLGIVGNLEVKGGKTCRVP